MNEHTQSGIYDLALTPSGEIIKIICGARYHLSFLATQFENIVHFYFYLLFLTALFANIMHFYNFVRTLIFVGTISLFNLTCTVQGVQIY